MANEAQDLSVTTFTAAALEGEPKILDTTSQSPDTLTADGLSSSSQPDISLTALQEQLDKYKPVDEYISRYGDFQTAQPFLQIADQFSATDYSPDKMAEAMTAIDRDRFSDLMWYAIDKSRPSIENWLLSDENFKNKIYNADPDWQLFQNWKASGGDVEELRMSGIDPDTPEGREFLRFRQENQRLRELDQKRSQAEQERARQQQEYEASTRIQSFVEEKDKWLDNLALSLNWGKEYEEDMIEVADATRAAIQKNPAIANQLRAALDYAAQNKMILASKAWNVAQAKIVEVFKSKASRRGNQITSLRNSATSTVKQQQSRVEISSPTSQTAAVGSPSNQSDAGLTFEQRVARNLQKANLAGKLPANFK